MFIIKDYQLVVSSKHSLPSLGKRGAHQVLPLLNQVEATSRIDHRLQNQFVNKLRFYSFLFVTINEVHGVKLLSRMLKYKPENKESDTVSNKTIIR